MKLRPVILAALAFTLAGCAGAARVQNAPVETTERPGFDLLSGSEAVATARERLQVFASDSMLGREATTEGELKASAFLADHLRRAGVLPGGDLENGARSYFQRFPVQTTRFTATSLRVEGLGDLRPGDDWLSFPNLVGPTAVDGLQLVFAGYGITAPDGSHNDYAGLDAAGKAVVVIGGKPAGLDSLRFPNGTVDAAGFQAKFVSALQNRAAAVILVNDDFFEENWDPFEVQMKSLSVAAAGEQQQTLPIPFVVLSEAASSRLLSEMGAPAGVAQAASNREAVSPFTSNMTVDVALAVENARREARNVVGYVPGDSKPDEYVAVGAHYDHLGTVDGVVHNGADDDGTGTVAVLSVAEAFARDRAAGLPTDRSLLFVFHTAEEKGLVGSDHFTSNPQQSVLGDIGNAVAQINLDMLGREHPDSMYVVGAYRLSNRYGALVDSVNRVIVPGDDPLFHLNTSFDRPDDPEQIYERSDHFNYARFGVPIVFFFDGMGANWGKNLPTDDYHRPTDDVGKINFDKLTRAQQLVYGIARATADAPRRPALNPGVEIEGAGE